MENVVIIGSGPAGLTAGIYAARAGLHPLVIEGLEPGGALLQTAHVANYPGFTGTVPGSTIIEAMRAQAVACGVRFALDVVETVDFDGDVKVLSTMMNRGIEARTVIVATGAGVTKTNLPGEAKYWGRGISACLTCDGAFYAGKKVAIVGEGLATTAAGNYLTKCSAKVIGTYAPDAVESFDGEGGNFTGITLRDGGVKVECSGAFLVTARKPQTDFLANELQLDEKGHVITTGARTSVEGVFAAGDCVEPRFKQAVIAAGAGARAAMEAQAFLARMRM